MKRQRPITLFTHRSADFVRRLSTSILITLIERIFFSHLFRYVDWWMISIKRRRPTSKPAIFPYHVNNTRPTYTYLTAKMADTLSMVSQSPIGGDADAAVDPFILWETWRVSPVIGRSWTNSCFIVDRHFGHSRKLWQINDDTSYEMGRWRDSCLFTPMHGTRMFSSAPFLFSSGSVQLPAHPPGADAQEDCTHTHTHVQVSVIYFNSRIDCMHHVLPEKFL